MSLNLPKKQIDFYMNWSYWEKTAFFQAADVVVIGAGIVGLHAALTFKKQQPQARVVVLERGLLPDGASTKNAGFACFGSVSELLMDLEENSEDSVFALVEKRWRGLQKLRQVLGDEALHFENLGGYELFMEEHFFEQCAHKIDFLNEALAQIIGKTVYRIADEQLKPFGFAGVNHLIFNAYEGQIHTGWMMKALLDQALQAGIEVRFGWEVEAIFPEEKNVILQLTSGLHWATRQVLVTTNGFARQLLPELLVQPGRGQVLVTAPVPNLPFAGTFHVDCGYTYFRNIDGRILLGGGRNLDFETEATTQAGLTDRIQNHLETLLRQVILPQKEIEIEHRWSGIMGFGPTQMPIVARLGDRIFCAVKMQGMGVAIGSLMGEEAANLLLEAQ
jgi:gamma-glutamylputrescine oxidase